MASWCSFSTSCTLVAQWEHILAKKRVASKAKHRILNAAQLLHPGHTLLPKPISVLESFSCGESFSFEVVFCVPSLYSSPLVSSVYFSLSISSA